jgi:AmpD protein
LTEELGMRGNPNIKADQVATISRGIELEGIDTTPYTDAQYVTLAEVTCSLLKNYPLRVRQRIVGHSDIAPGRKADPGLSFDWTRYRSLLQDFGC